MPVRTADRRSPSCGRTCTRCRSIRTGFRTRPRTTPRPGASASAPNRPPTLTDAEYDVCIDSTLEDGHLTYGECYLPGESADEVLLSCHVCHPSLCNDNLSGIAVAVSLAEWLSTPLGAPVVVPVPVHSGNHRVDHLAGAESGSARRDPARPGAHRPRRPRRVWSTSAAGAALPRSTARPRTCLKHSGEHGRDPGLHPVRLRRASVLLAGHQPGGRLPVAHAVRRVSRVPHVGRQPGLRQAGAARGRRTGPARRS